MVKPLMYKASQYSMNIGSSLIRLLIWRAAEILMDIQQQENIHGDRHACMMQGQRAMAGDQLTGAAGEEVPAALAVSGDVVDEQDVLLHRPRPAPEHLLLPRRATTAPSRRRSRPTPRHPPFHPYNLRSRPGRTLVPTNYTMFTFYDPRCLLIWSGHDF